MHFLSAVDIPDLLESEAALLRELLDPFLKLFAIGAMVVVSGSGHLSETSLSVTKQFVRIVGFPLVERLGELSDALLGGRRGVGDRRGLRYPPGLGLAEPEVWLLAVAPGAAG
jgi:hypothetical protein